MSNAEVNYGLGSIEVERLNGEAFNRWLWDAASDRERAPDGRSWKQIVANIKSLAEGMRLCVVADKENNTDVEYGAFAVPDRVIGAYALAIRLPGNFYEVADMYSPEVKRAVLWHILQIDVDPTWTTRVLLPLNGVYRLVDAGYSVAVPRTDGFARDKAALSARPDNAPGSPGSRDPSRPYVVEEATTGRRYMYDPVSRESTPLEEWDEQHSPAAIARMDEEKRKARIDPLEFIRCRDAGELKGSFEAWWNQLTAEQRKIVAGKGEKGVLLVMVNIGLKPAASFDRGDADWIKAIPMNQGVNTVGNDVYNGEALREWFTRNGFDPDAAVSRFGELSMVGERAGLSSDDHLLLGVAYGIGREDAVKFAERLAAIDIWFGDSVGKEIELQLVRRFGASEAEAKLTAKFLAGGCFDRKDKGFETLVGPGFVRKHGILSEEQIQYLIKSVLVDKYGYIFRTDRDDQWIGSFKRTLERKLISAGVFKALREFEITPLIN